MVDFTPYPITKKAYDGANGPKIAIRYNDELYMLKFPSVPHINKEMSYANSCISEYLGCHIFESIGINAQKTILGTYNTSGKQKIVVACKDFTIGGLILQNFASLKNTYIDSKSNGYGTELSDILDAIEKQTIIDSKILSSWFWDMFIVDALIGNWDRHNGNWGFLYNPLDDTISLAPIFDCGSCLFPQVDEEMMNLILENKDELNIRIFERPLSIIKINNQKIPYFKFISSLKNEECNNALKRILPKIDMDKIYQIIDDTPYISSLQKAFYKTIISERKKQILDFSFQKLSKRKKK